MKKQQVVIAVLLASLSASAWGMRRSRSMHAFQAERSQSAPPLQAEAKTTHAGSPQPVARSLQSWQQSSVSGLSPRSMTNTPAPSAIRAPAKRVAYAIGIQQGEFKKGAHATAEAARAVPQQQRDRKRRADGTPKVVDLKQQQALLAQRIADAKREQAEIDALIEEYASEVNGTTTFRHEDFTRPVHILFNGKQVPIIPVRSDVDVAKYNRKRDKAIQSKNAHRQNLLDQIAFQKNACLKSIASLAGVLFVCGYIHKHGILEYLAEHHGPMSANALQVAATLACGAFAQKAWQAGWNVWSTLPEKVKKMDEEIKTEERLRVSGKIVDQFLGVKTKFPQSSSGLSHGGAQRRVAFSARSTGYSDGHEGYFDLSPQEAISAGIVEAQNMYTAAAPASEMDPEDQEDQGLGVGIGLDDDAIQRFRTARAAIAAAAPSTPAVTVEVGDLEHNDREDTPLN